MKYELDDVREPSSTSTKPPARSAHSGEGSRSIVSLPKRKVDVELPVPHMMKRPKPADVTKESASDVAGRLSLSSSSSEQGVREAVSYFQRTSSGLGGNGSSSASGTAIGGVSSGASSGGSGSGSGSTVSKNQPPVPAIPAALRPSKDLMHMAPASFKYQLQLRVERGAQYGSFNTETWGATQGQTPLPLNVQGNDLGQYYIMLCARKHAHETQKVVKERLAGNERNLHKKLVDKVVASYWAENAVVSLDDGDALHAELLAVGGGGGKREAWTKTVSHELVLRTPVAPNWFCYSSYRTHDSTRLGGLNKDAHRLIVDLFFYKPEGGTKCDLRGAFIALFKPATSAP